jgi:hypothetical protein
VVWRGGIEPPPVVSGDPLHESLSGLDVDDGDFHHLHTTVTHTGVSTTNLTNCFTIFFTGFMIFSLCFTIREVNPT